ncbi:hypothetical protein Tco_0619911 [Tanacetum coccineum]
MLGLEMVSGEGECVVCCGCVLLNVGGCKNTRCSVPVVLEWCSCVCHLSDLHGSKAYVSSNKVNFSIASLVWDIEQWDTAASGSSFGYCSGGCGVGDDTLVVGALDRNVSESGLICCLWLGVWILEYHGIGAGDVTVYGCFVVIIRFDTHPISSCVPVVPIVNGAQYYGGTDAFASALCCGGKQLFKGVVALLLLASLQQVEVFGADMREMQPPAFHGCGLISWMDYVHRILSAVTDEGGRDSVLFQTLLCFRRFR